MSDEDDSMYTGKRIHVGGAHTDDDADDRNDDNFYRMATKTPMMDDEGDADGRASLSGSRPSTSRPIGSRRESSGSSGNPINFSRRDRGVRSSRNFFDDADR